MTRTAIVFFIGLVATPAFAQTADQIQRGQQVYTAQKCGACHSIAGTGNKRGPLDGVGAKLKADDIRLWIVDAPQMAAKTGATRKPVMKAYASLPKEDLDALIAYMVSLKNVMLPDAVRNPISIVGITIATAMAWLFLALLTLDLLGYLPNPYAGLLVFVAMPTLFLLGLLLIPLGAWWAARRRRAGRGEAEWPVIDLRQPRQRGVLGGVLALTFINVLIVSAAGFGTVHYMERTEFCGQVCHTTMEPEFSAHQAWPHAQVTCVSCHVGGGAGSFIESKLAGTRQLYHLITNQIPRPVPTPVRSLGRTEETCGGCHRMDRLYGDRVRVMSESASDEANTESATRLRMHVGDLSSGIHRHIGLDIEYVATDARREAIPYVRVTSRSGEVREFTGDGATAAQIAAGTRRRMDCTDCHNRPAHSMSSTPERAVDAAIVEGRMPRGLAFVRREALAAVKAEHPDRAAALIAIATRLQEFYATRPGSDAALVARAVASTQEVWTRNVFPAMRVTWGTYPNHLGHIDTPGCFRCHDDNHKAKDGRVISQDCELCHAME